MSANENNPNIGAPNDITDAVQSAREGAQPQSIFQRAVVVEVLDNLSAYDWDDKDAVKKRDVNLKNPRDSRIAPRNSIIARVVSGGKGREETEDHICFPFFSSHISLPLKAGEQVWVLFETLGGQQSRGYWLSRIHAPNFVEDPNYTHLDRRHGATDPKGNLSADADGGEVELSPLPTFQNGKSQEMEDEDLFTLADREAFEKCFTETLEFNNFLIEPVPRYTKRPGDLVLQGSHNATIVLGTDRGYKAGDEIDREKSNEALDDPLEAGKGAIDIVVGRGRLNKPPADLDGGKDRTKDPVRTEPRVVVNEVGGDPALETKRDASYETDKNISVKDDKKSNTKTDACEGDPDFVNDAARLYLTMKSNPDEEFAIVPDNIPTAFATAPEEAKDISAAVVKADHVRVVARKTGLDPQKDFEMSGDNAPEEINGSIRIIKEGKKDDDAASIYLLSDGTIQISGKAIYVGRTSDDGGKEDGSGEKGSEEWMRMSDFEKWADGLIDAINTAFETAEKGINANGDAINKMASAGASGGICLPFGPNPVLGPAFSQGIAPGGMSGQHMHAPDKSSIEEYKSTKDPMEAIKSERIFGE
jgi:hypothetical protein